MSDEYCVGKKIIPFRILDILRTYTDEEHKLNQQGIIEKLREIYHIECDRRTVARTINLLSDEDGLGYYILHDKEGYYFADREFDNNELRMLVDMVLYSKVLTKGQSKDLLDKLVAFGTEQFRKSVPQTKMLGGMDWSQNKHFRQSLDKINRAIQKHCKIEFSYCQYDVNLKLQDKGYRYKVNPYQLIMANGFYFLMGNLDKYDNISYYRVDRIDKVNLLEAEKVKDKKMVKGYAEIWELPQHQAEHIYMFSGKSIDVQIKTTTGMITDLVDWFGKNIRIKQLNDKEILATFKVNENAIFYWLLQYGMYVEVMKPQSLRDRMKEAAKELTRKYC